MTDGTNTLFQDQAEPVEAPEIENEIEDDEEPVDLDAEQPSDDEDDDGESDGEQDDDDGSEPEAEAETVTLDVDGQSYEVPAALKDKFLMQQDYTRKTQEVAELRKSVEARAAQVDQLANVTQEELDVRVQYENVTRQLEQYSQVDWQQLENEDIVAAGSHFRQYQQLRELQGQLLQKGQQISQQRSASIEQMTASRLQETAEFASKNLPNWSQELDAEITNFAVKELGFDVDTLKGAYNPQIYRTLYLAHLGQKTLANSQKAKPQPSKAKAKPLSKVKGRAGAVNAPVQDIDDMEAYAAARKKQMGIG